MKEDKNSKRYIDSIIFVCTCFLLLLLNVIHNNVQVDEDISKPVKPDYNLKVEKNYEKYSINIEQLLKKNFFENIDIYYISNIAKYIVSGRFVNFKNVIIDKKNNIFYNKSPNVVYPDVVKNEISKNLKLFNNDLKSQNIKLYVLVEPKKEMVYAPLYIRKNFYNKAINIFYDIENESGVNIVFPLKNLIEYKESSKQNNVFFKTDNYLTFEGTLVEYYELMNKIRQDIPNIKIIEQNDLFSFLNKEVKIKKGVFFHKGANCLINANLSESFCDKLLDVNYRYYGNINSFELQMQKSINAYFDEEIYNYFSGSNLKLMVLTNSLNENIMEFIPYSFKHVAKLRFYDDIINDDFDAQYKEKFVNALKNEINEFKPNIVLVYLDYDSLPIFLKNIMAENK